MNIVFLLNWHDLWAQPSLFLSTEEIYSIYSHLPSPIIEKPCGSESLSLLAILYVDKNHWSVWANNRILRSEISLDIDGFHIEQILFNSVTFSWISTDSSTVITFSLRPGQTYKKEE